MGMCRISVYSTEKHSHKICVANQGRGRFTGSLIYIELDLLLGLFLGLSLSISALGLLWRMYRFSFPG